MSKYSVLVARLNKELAKIQTMVQVAVSQVSKAKKSDVDYLRKYRWDVVNALF